MARYPECAKLVSYDAPEAEEEESDVSDEQIEGEVRVILLCDSVLIHCSHFFFRWKRYLRVLLRLNSVSLSVEV